VVCASKGSIAVVSSAISAGVNAPSSRKAALLVPARACSGVMRRNGAGRPPGELTVPRVRLHARTSRSTVAAGRAARPAADQREQARSPPAARSAIRRAELRERLLLRRGRKRNALGDAAGPRAISSPPRATARRGAASASPCSSGLAEHARDARADHQQRVRRRARASDAPPSAGRPERSRQRLGVARELVHDRARALAGEERDGARAFARRGPPRRAPRRALLVSAKQKPSLRVAVVARSTSPGGPADVAGHELERAPIVAFARLPWPSTLMPEFMPIERRTGPYHDHRPTPMWSRAHRGCLKAFGARSLDRRDHHGQVLGLAARPSPR